MMFGLFESGYENITSGNMVMILIGSLLIYLAIKKNMEPLLLGPIGFATILVNLPVTGLAEDGGFMEMVYRHLIQTGIIPLLIFLGIGAMTDFTPLLANPKTFILGAAAQIGIYSAMFFAIIFGFTQKEAAVIGIIGGADGPTTIYTASQLAPQIMGAVTVAAYSYMALVPMIQPPIIKALTTKEQRRIKMIPLRKVSNTEKIIFPISVTIITGLLVPSAVPLVGMLMFGNLIKISGVMDRLSKTSANELINIATIFLGIGVGFMMQADAFLNVDTLKILILGVVAFTVATAGGILFGQLMYVLSKGKINPMIGAAGVSAVPMSSRVVNKLGMEENKENFLLMYAMGPNVAGVIGSAIAAGVFIGLLG